LPIISINGKDSTHTTIKLPVYYIPKTLSTAEIQKGLYVEDRFLPMPVKTPYSLYAGVFVLLLASLALMYKMLKNPVKQWIKIKKLESKQKKWLIQAEQKIKNPDWIAAFVKHNKEYIEAHTNEKWTSLTPTELEKIQFPEIFQSIKDDFLKICQIEYEQDFSGKTAGPESKNLAMNILKKMRLIFELEKQQKRDL
jgi:hypothetical protein